MTKYFLQPNGDWKQGADGRSVGKTLAQLKAAKVPRSKIKGYKKKKT